MELKSGQTVSGRNGYTYVEFEGMVTSGVFIKTSDETELIAGDVEENKRDRIKGTGY